ncbi:MAG TPA: gluconate 2-dehydrogenase subunit 3 family protein [Gammaproteobacteria bacterium]|nr:gluconate 2-dehydrogenase subunit 3 family protein [Gammaproteobacteria bacterium]
MTDLDRRSFLKSLGVASGATTLAPMVPLWAQQQDIGTAATETPTQPGGTPPGVATKEAPGTAQAYVFFKPEEARFIEAAVARLIPTDDNGPGATEAGVANYLDKQLAGAWGAGERLYRSGPWHAGLPTQGYQLPFTPAELFRNGLRAIENDLRENAKTSFTELSAEQQDDYLRLLEAGKKDLDGIPSAVFFASLWQMTLEGFFGDPVYGGNKGMVSWELIGFPGAYANYYHLVDQHGIKFNRKPMSLAETAQGQILVHPDIPAYQGAKERR